MGLYLQHLFNRIVTGDESWVRHYQPETKDASMHWEHPSSLSTKKFKVTPSPGMDMLTVFWDSHGVLLTHFQKCGENVNSASYCEVLLKLQDAIRRKHPGQLARGVLLHHYSGNVLNFLLTLRTWSPVTFICFIIRSQSSELALKVFKKKKKFVIRTGSTSDTYKVHEHLTSDFRSM
jgi:hypothetical protein